MPRQFMNRGDKLAFSNGIIGLAVVAMIIVVIFSASVNRMIPLYAVGCSSASRFPRRGWWSTGCASRARAGSAGPP